MPEGDNNEIPPLPDGMTVWAWPADEARPRKLADWRTAGQGGQGVIWIDLEQPTQWDAIADALDQMRLPIYQRAMLGHVIQGMGPTEPGSHTVPWYDADVARDLAARRRATFLTAIGLHAEIKRGIWDPAWLFTCPVQMLVSSTWLITSRMAGLASTGDLVARSDLWPVEELIEYASQRKGRYSEPADLATLLLRALADSFPPALAELDQRLQDLQQGYMRGIDDPKGSGNIDGPRYRGRLLEVKWALDGLFRTILRLSRPATPPRSAWFFVQQAVELAEEIQDLLERTAAEIGRQREEIREAFALMASTQASAQLQLAEEARAARIESESRAAAFERSLQVAGFVLLPPAIVGAFWGAVPDFLGVCDGWEAIIVGGSMVLAGLLGGGALPIVRRRLEKRSSSDSATTQAASEERPEHEAQQSLEGAKEKPD